jgi:hypothetical protein
MMAKIEATVRIPVSVSTGATTRSLNELLVEVDAGDLAQAIENVIFSHKARELGITYVVSQRGFEISFSITAPSGLAKEAREDHLWTKLVKLFLETCPK